MVKELNSDYHFTHELPYQKELGTGKNQSFFLNSVKLTLIFILRKLAVELQ